MRNLARAILLIVVTSWVLLLGFQWQLSTSRLGHANAGFPHRLKTAWSVVFISDQDQLLNSLITATAVVSTIASIAVGTRSRSAKTDVHTSTRRVSE
jgi:hypothetical protein